MQGHVQTPAAMNSNLLKVLTGVLLTQPVLDAVGELASYSGRGKTTAISSEIEKRADKGGDQEHPIQG